MAMTAERLSAEEFGERLFTYRDSRRWTQEELAKRAGTGRSAIVLSETGQTYPRLTTQRRLARAFGISVDELLHGDLPEVRGKDAKKT